MDSIPHRHQFTFFVSSNHKCTDGCVFFPFILITKWKCTKTDLWHKRTLCFLLVRALQFDIDSILNWKKGNDFPSLPLFRFMLFDRCTDSNESLVSEHVQNSYESAKLGYFNLEKRQKKSFHCLDAVLIIYTFDIISMHSSYLKITKRYCFVNGKSNVPRAFQYCFIRFQKNKWATKNIAKNCWNCWNCSASTFGIEINKSVCLFLLWN